MKKNDFIPFHLDPEERGFFKDYMDELKGIFFTKHGQCVEFKIKDSKISNGTEIKEKEQEQKNEAPEKQLFGQLNY